MDFIYQNSIKYVNIEQVAEFLEYKRVKQFVNRVKSKVELIKEKFIEVRELVKILVKSTKEKVEELIDIVLKEEQQKEIDSIIDKFNEATNNEYDLRKDYIPKIIQNVWYLISAKNLDIITQEQLNWYLSLYDLTEKEEIK